MRRPASTDASGAMVDGKAGTPCFLLAVFSVMFAAVILHSLPAHAYPPAPHHEFYGIVRSELGDPLNVGDAEVILQTATGVRLASPIVSGVPDMNYRLSVPMDSGITADAYKPTALHPAVGFTFRVRIGSATYLPIEVKADYSLLGQPGQRTRLDLTLGEDLDGDGLPDAWERALLSIIGINNLDAINPNDDTDGDGLSNLDEYIAGTYAFDPKDAFELKIATATDRGAVLDFTAIKGRTYSILGSPDMKSWFPISFQFPGSTAVRSEHLAVDTRPTRIEVLSPETGTPHQFFKLVVR